ncbi:(2Fe-2S)-binding protein [Acetobacter farinalis]|uniref:(2Fe-2S)-binding protein n=1 Tax=Acetobacter farinalis TaxID=1260984 RepID=A0ABT3QAK9_9PROT|nr:(2Fe-2S)-binding protein [Acetobacter farinalis]MCX2562325.1 (2Fe-2S)-binding protein [Acetobacter farinalis]NHO30935.1 bacterioferritin [Acetobacter farinalis]
MVICSCNRLTHTDVETAVARGATRPSEIYASRQCKAQCGNCVPGVVCLLREARMRQKRATEQLAPICLPLTDAAQAAMLSA